MYVARVVMYVNANTTIVIVISVESTYIVLLNLHKNAGVERKKKIEFDLGSCRIGTLNK